MRPRDYFRASQAALEGHSKEARENLIVEAFGAWMAGYGGSKTFNDFLQHLGLGEKTTKPRSSKEANLAYARRIMERDRARTI